MEELGGGVGFLTEAAELIIVLLRCVFSFRFIDRYDSSKDWSTYEHGSRFPYLTLLVKWSFEAQHPQTFSLFTFPHSEYHYLYR